MGETKEVEVSSGGHVTKPVIAKIVEQKDKTIGQHEMDKIVDQIVDKWNEIITGFENTTISLCLMIKDMLKHCPDETIKEILQRVKTHPRIKRFVSIDRIYQGMKLVRKRQDLIEYHLKKPEERAKIIDKPYLKSDGEIFWEFYFEIEKRPLSDAVKTFMENEAKSEKWTYRTLRQKLSEYKDEMEHPGEFENRKFEKAELIKSVVIVCRNMNLENVKKVLDYARNLQMQTLQGNKDVHRKG